MTLPCWLIPKGSCIYFICSTCKQNTLTRHGGVVTDGKGGQVVGSSGRRPHPRRLSQKRRPSWYCVICRRGQNKPGSTRLRRGCSGTCKACCSSGISAGMLAPWEPADRATEQRRTCCSC
jgi:hypothetical protein